MHSKTLPNGCDQQGRHNTRRERWLAQQWRETRILPDPQTEEPLTKGCALMAAALVAALAGFAAYGPWL